MSGLENLSDRDLLIQNTTNIENLCKQFKEMKRENKKEHETLFKLLDAQSKGTVSNRLFYVTLILIVGAIGYLTVSVSDLRNNITKNAVCIEKLEAPAIRGL